MTTSEASSLVRTSMEKGSVFSKFKLLTFHPEDFFKSISKEKGWKKPYIVFVLSFLVYAFFVVVWSTIFLGFVSNIAVNVESTALSNKIQEKWLEVIYGLFTYVVLILIMPIFIPLTHFIAIKSGGKGSVDDTAKATIYPNVPGFILGWIPVIGSIVWIWCLYIWYIGFKTLHKMSKKQFLIFGILEAIFSILIFLIISFLIGIILLSFGVPVTGI